MRVNIFGIIFYPIIRTDWILFILIAGLAYLGFATLDSAGVSETLTNRQSTYLIAGIFLMVVSACMVWTWWKFLAFPLYIGTLILLIAVAFIGIEVNNSQRWLDIGPINFQPSELAKISVPLLVAVVYCSTKKRYFWQHLVALVLIAVPAALIFAQPDLGTAVMVVASGCAVIFMAGLSWWFIGSGAIAIAFVAPFFWTHGLKDYQRDRIMSVIDPYSDPLGAGYHTIQSSIAVGSGGMWGKGLGQGTQSQLGFLPEKHTDFIFAVYAEELGFVGSLTLLGIIMLIFFKMFWVAGRSKDECGGMIVATFAFAFVVQTLINLGMVSGVLPVVGLPLPLVSYGGTSLLTFMVIFGICMSVNRYKPIQHGYSYI